MEQKKITIYNSNNHKFEANLLLSFDVPEFDSKYIVYSFPSLDDMTTINVGKLKLEKEKEYTIEELNNDAEWEFVKKVLFELIKED